MNANQKTQKMVLTAMLVAIFVVLSIYGTIDMFVMKITVKGLPVILGAIILGPVEGMLVGLMGELINQVMVHGLTATTLLWIIPHGVRGLLIGLYARKKGTDIPPLSLAFIIIASSVVVTTLNTGVMYIDSKLYGWYSFATIFGGMVTRYISGIVTSVVYVVLTYPTLRLLKRAVPALAKKEAQS